MKAVVWHYPAPVPWEAIEWQPGYYPVLKGRTLAHVRNLQVYALEFPGSCLSADSSMDMYGVKALYVMLKL